MLLSALVLRLNSRLARLLRGGAPVGDDARAGSAVAVAVGGRCETQSCTSSDTRGFRIMLRVFLDDGCVVMMTVG